MDSYQFYKSLYDRELTRRNDLDSGINLPLTILSIIVAANTYLIKEAPIAGQGWREILQRILIAAITVIIAICIVFLTRSYNNFFKGFAYPNFGLTKEIRKYEKNLDIHNSRLETKISFEEIIVDRLAGYVQDHTIFNDQRGKDLYLAKTMLIILISLTAVHFLLFITKYM